MNIVDKFRINTEDFRIYFDNEKKTHIAQNIESGEKTNVGVLGIFLQMGILKPLNEIQDLSGLSRRIDDLESKVNEIIEKLGDSETRPTEVVTEKPQSEEVVEEIKSEEKTEGIGESEKEKREKEKFDVKENIMEKALKGISEKDKNVATESKEEIENWMEI